jgi:hypothetical protein
MMKKRHPQIAQMNTDFGVRNRGKNLWKSVKSVEVKLP